MMTALHPMMKNGMRREGAELLKHDGRWDFESNVRDVEKRNGHIEAVACKVEVLAHACNGRIS
jgi:hypothetical protein